VLLACEPLVMAAEFVTDSLAAPVPSHGKPDDVLPPIAWFLSVLLSVLLSDPPLLSPSHFDVPVLPRRRW
jgi:hypothetical protein